MCASIAALAFLKGEGRDHQDRSLADVLAFDDAALERHHDYIQWLFPLPEVSRFNALAPVLAPANVAFLRSDDGARANLLKARDRMLAFYRSNDHWLTTFDHNHLRITRIIRCLALCVGKDEAQSFHREILALVAAAGNPVNEESLGYWRGAAGSDAARS